MKKLFINSIKIIVAFVLGLVVAGSIGVYAITILSSDVSYDNTTSGSSATTVQDAIDDLYTKANNNLTIVEIYSGNSMTDHNVDVKSILPDKYSELTVDDFYLKNIQLGLQASGMSGANQTAYANTIINSYDATTGTLKLNRSGIVYNTSLHNMNAYYTVYAIFTQ